MSSQWRDRADALALAGLVVCVVAVDRFHVAAGTLEYLDANKAPEDPARPALAPSPSATDAAEPVVVDHFGAWRVAVGVVGAALAIYVTLRLAHLIANAGAARWLRRLGLAAVAAWALWQLDGHWTVEVLAAGLAVAALVASGRHTIGDLPEAGRRASAVTIQVVVVAVVFALVVLVPYTSAQLIDVLRAWGDSGWKDEDLSRPIAGIAGALLLGAAVRGSAVRLLLPPDGEPKSQQADQSPPVRSKARRVLSAVACVAVALAAIALWIVGVRVAAVVVACALAVTLATDERPPLVPEAQTGVREGNLRRLAATLGVAPLAIVLAGLVTALTDSLVGPAEKTLADLRLGLYTLAVIVLFAFVAGDAHRRPRTIAKQGNDTAPQRVSLAALACVTAFAPAAIFDLEPWVGLVSAALLLALALALALRLFGEHGGPELWAAGGATLGMALGVYVDPVDAPRAHGTFAVVFVGATGVLMALHLLAARLARRATPVRGLPRIPAALAVGVWVVVAILGFDDGRHQARTMPRAAGPGTIEHAVAGWLRREWTDGGRPSFLPMLIVGASGGGSKAAYWTDVVLDCTFGQGEPEGGECAREQRGRGPRRLRRLFLTSSVSGGSVGVFHFVARGDAVTGDEPWVDDAAKEVLSPAMAWGAFHDLPVFMFGLPTDPRECEGEVSCGVHADRALVQEAAVAGHDDLATLPADGLLPRDRAGPVTVFNGAEDGARARVLLSPLALAPDRHPNPTCATPPSRSPAAAAIDGHDALRPGEDLAPVTAAMLSARFPGVAPAGRLGDEGPSRGGNSCRPPPILPAVTVRDGGYVENSGLLTIVDLLPRIQSVIARWKRADPARRFVDVRPVVVSIDDDPVILDAAPRSAVSRRDLLGISRRAGSGYLTTIARERLSACLYPGVTYLRISPPPRVGARAASGWELSETVRRQDLDEALGSDKIAGMTVARLQRILDGRRPGCQG